MSLEDQPAPEPGETEVWPLVIREAEAAGAVRVAGLGRERDALGRKRYGTALQTFNGRDSLVDALQEGLDLLVYLRQYLEENPEVQVVHGLKDVYGILLHEVETLAHHQELRDGRGACSTSS